MKNHIFVDLDETLIHTFDFYEEPTKDAVDVEVAEMKGKVTLRKGALEFLKRLRERGDVYMLTAAMTDYANVMNEKFGFGFAPNDIYAREDVAAGQLDPSAFDEGKVYLFDNLPRHENRDKIFFLRPLGETKYVQVSGFYNNRYQAFKKEEIDRLVGQVS